MNNEERFQAITQLASNIPNMAARPVSNETHVWLGRFHAHAADMNQLSIVFDLGRLAATLKHPAVPMPQQVSVSLRGLVYTLLAIAELKAPANMRGGFILAGNAFDALTAFGRIFAEVQQEVLMVDPYMDSKALTDFAILAAEGKTIRLLAEATKLKPTLEPAIHAWTRQYQDTRPLIARATAHGVLHDRLLILDRSKVYLLTQSFNAFAARSPATITVVDAETAALKIEAYDAFWVSAAPIM